MKKENVGKEFYPDISIARFVYKIKYKKEKEKEKKKDILNDFISFLYIYIYILYVPVCRKSAATCSA